MIKIRRSRKMTTLCPLGSLRQSRLWAMKNSVQCRINVLYSVSVKFLGRSKVSNQGLIFSSRSLALIAASECGTMSQLGIVTGCCTRVPVPPGYSRVRVRVVFIQPWPYAYHQPGVGGSVAETHISTPL